MDEASILVLGVVGLAVVAIVVTGLQSRQRRALAEQVDEVEGERAEPGAVVRWGHCQEWVEHTVYQGNNAVRRGKWEPFTFVEIQATQHGPPMRPSTLPRALRSLAQALDREHTTLYDDRIRALVKTDLRDEERRILFLFNVLRGPVDEVFTRLVALSKRPGFGYFVLSQALEHLAEVPGVEALARRVEAEAPVPLRLQAAIILGEADRALDLALKPEAPPTLAWKAVERFGEALAALGDRVLRALCTLDDETGQRARTHLRTLPVARAVEVLTPMVETEGGLLALTLLLELAPEAAQPRVRRLASQPNPERRVGVLVLLHTFDPEAAEAGLCAVVADFDGDARTQAIRALGRLGTERTVPILRRLADEGGVPAEDAEAALVEVRERLSQRPVGALALADHAPAGGLSLQATAEREAEGT